MHRRGDRLPASLKELRSPAEMDEVAATAARRQYRAEGLTPLEPAADLGALLGAGERIFATRPQTVLQRRTRRDEPVDSASVTGDLVLTSARLILVGDRCLAFDLEDIEEAVLAEEQLLLVMRNGVGLSLAVAQPRLLRVQIAAARAIARVPARGPHGAGLG